MSEKKKKEKQELCHIYKEIQLHSGCSCDVYKRQRNSDTPFTGDYIDKILFWTDDHTTKDDKLERFITDMNQRFPYFEARCNICFYDYVNYSFIQAYNNDLKTDSYKSLLADNFLAVYFAYQTIDDVLGEEQVKHLEKEKEREERMKRNNPDENKDDDEDEEKKKEEKIKFNIDFFYPSQSLIFPLFKSQTESVFKKLNHQKSFVKNPCIESIYIDFMPTMSYCSLDRNFHYSIGHHRVYIKRPFVHETKHQFKTGFLYNQINYYK